MIATSADARTPRRRIPGRVSPLYAGSVTHKHPPVPGGRYPRRYTEDRCSARSYLKRATSTRGLLRNWHLRDRFEAADVAIPDDRALIEELLATDYRIVDSSGSSCHSEGRDPRAVGPLAGPRRRLGLRVREHG